MNMSSRFIQLPIETNTKMQDSSDKSQIVRELAQIQYQICITHLNPPQLLPCHQSLPPPALTHHAALSGLTVSQARILLILTSHALLCPASLGTLVIHLHLNKIFMNHKFLFGKEMENLLTFLKVSWVRSQQKKRLLKHMFLELS